jgi:hypothetical protein
MCAGVFRADQRHCSLFFQFSRKGLGAICHLARILAGYRFHFPGGT